MILLIDTQPLCCKGLGKRSPFAISARSRTGFCLHPSPWALPAESNKFDGPAWCSLVLRVHGFRVVCAFGGFGFWRNGCWASGVNGLGRHAAQNLLSNVIPVCSVTCTYQQPHHKFVYRVYRPTGDSTPCSGTYTLRKTSELSIQLKTVWEKKRHDVGGCVSRILPARIPRASIQPWFEVNGCSNQNRHMSFGTWILKYGLNGPLVKDRGTKLK